MVFSFNDREKVVRTPLRRTLLKEAPLAQIAKDFGISESDEMEDDPALAAAELVYLEGEAEHLTMELRVMREMLGGG